MTITRRRPRYLKDNTSLVLPNGKFGRSRYLPSAEEFQRVVEFFPHEVFPLPGIAGYSGAVDIKHLRGNPESQVVLIHKINDVTGVEAGVFWMDRARWADIDPSCEALPPPKPTIPPYESTEYRKALAVEVDGVLDKLRPLPKASVTAVAQTREQVIGKGIGEAYVSASEQAEIDFVERRMRNREEARKRFGHEKVKIVVDPDMVSLPKKMIVRPSKVVVDSASIHNQLSVIREKRRIAEGKRKAEIRNRKLLGETSKKGK